MKTRRNAHRLEGWTAIAYAEKHGGTLKKFADPTERALKRVSIEKAKAVAREDARLIYMDAPHGWQSNRGNPRKVKGRSTTLRNMASVTIQKLPNGVVKITGRKMAGKHNPEWRSYSYDPYERPRHGTWGVRVVIGRSGPRYKAVEGEGEMTRKEAQQAAKDRNSGGWRPTRNSGRRRKR